MGSNLPYVVIRAVLNGVPRPGKRACVPALDPRWRFMARAVCSTWRDIIEHPTRCEARGFGRHPHKRTTWLHHEAPERCPKWAAGRVVCMTAISEWIAARPDLWARDKEDDDSLYEWCARNTGATRKQVAVALCASGTPGSIMRTIDHHMQRMYFECCCDPDSTECMPSYFERDRLPERATDHYDNWDAENTGCSKLFFAVLASVMARLGLTEALYELCDHWGVHEPRQSWLHDALAYGQPELAEHLIRRGVPCGEDEWRVAARAKKSTCVARLLALAQSDPQLICVYEHTYQGYSKSVRWLSEGVSTGRVDCLALLDAHGIDFDAGVVFHMAKACGSVHVLDWLYRRACRSPTPEKAVRDIMPTSFQEEDMASGMPPSRSVLAWLCDVAGYDPRKRKGQLYGMFVGACQNDDVACAFYIAERWPDVLARANIEAMRFLCAACLYSRRAVPHLLRALKLFEQISGRDPTAQQALAAELDLWGCTVLLFDNHYRSQRVGLTDTYFASLVRVLCCAAMAELPHAVDASHAWERPLPPCTCVGRLHWQHNSPLTGDVVDSPTGGQRCIGPTSIQMTPGLAPWMSTLARWVMPRPVRRNTLFPKPASGFHESRRSRSKLGSIPTRYSHGTDAPTELVGWLAERDLLVPVKPDAAKKNK